MTPIRAAFLMEQSLGHVTHAMNLRAYLETQKRVVPTWHAIEFEAHGIAGSLPLWRSNSTVRGSWRARRRLQAAMAAEPHDAAMFHTQQVSLFSSDIMRRLPSVVSLDATPLNFDRVGHYYGHRPDGDGWLGRQKFRIIRRAFEAAAGLVSWSEWARRSLIDDYGIDDRKIRIIAPGAAPVYFRIGERRAAEPDAQAAGGAPRPLRALFVGGDFRRKGGDVLLEAMRGALAERCELHLVTKDASVQPQRNVFVHRNVGPNSPELLALFAEADVFVLPSRADCLAIVLMEATAAGLPVVTTDVGALGEAIVPGESGLLVPTDDAAALTRALETLAGDAARRRRMGRAGFALAGQKFDAAQNNRALLDLIVDVAQAGRAARRTA